jgi:hypothetical protein
MSFWQATMKRSVKLSRTYFIMGVLMSVFGTATSNMYSLIPADLLNIEGTSIDLMNSMPLASVSFLSLSALMFSMPVMMLFVFDKNTGVLEYLLSTGFSQFDVYAGYVKASSSLAIILLTFSNVLNTAIGIYMGTDLGLLATIVVLTFAVGLSGVLLGAVSMMAFSSFQKTQLGANQPLGIAIGMVPVLPALFVAFIFPSYALVIIISIAIVTLLISLGLLLFSGRLIPREKLLP